MKLKSKAFFLWLLTLSLLVPVWAEMIINKEGLPTPWPVAIIGSLITLLTATLIASSKKRKEIETPSRFLKWLWDEVITKLFTLYSLFNSFVPLLGSFNSLRVHGLSGFQYPELVPLALFPFVVVSIITIFLGGDYMWDKHWDNFGSSSKKVFFLFFWLFIILMSIFSLVWQIVAIGIYAHLNNFVNASAQFVTNCTQVPDTSWQTMKQCFLLDSGISYKCYLGSRNSWIIGLFVRVFVLCFPLLFVVLTLNENLSKIEKYEDASENLNKKSKILDSLNVGNYLGRITNYSLKFFIASVTIFYVLSIALIQYKGLDTTGLEVCEVNQDLTSSKTGYVQEWYKQELTSLKQLTLV